MRWFKKPAKADDIESASVELPPAPFSMEIVESKLNSLLSAISEAGGLDGVETLVRAIAAKSEAFQQRLSGSALESEDVRVLSAIVFSVRRKIGAHLPGQGSRLADAIEKLRQGHDAVENRLEEFSSTLGDDKKLRRGLWDFGAEILHFSEPDRFPLLTRWVWDTNTTAGALREFLKGNDTLRTVPIEAGLAAAVHYRQWFYEALAELGFYRDLPFLVDLLWAQAYADYAKSLSMQFGLIDAQFGAKQDPLELVVKLLGIDAAEGRLKTFDSAPAVQ